MAEETESLDAGAEASRGIDPAAMALALGSASRAKADAYLDDQRSLIYLQMDHLREQLKQLRLTIWQQRIGVFLRAASAFMGVAVAGFLGAFVWNAARADGLIVESFSVPPDLAARGLTGEVVAGQLLNNLSTMQSQNPAGRSASTFTNNWGNDFKVEIPETGISVGELNRYLREWLGHETHITGAVYHIADGIAVTAQVGQKAHATLTGNEAEFDRLLQQTSETIFRATQPYRYAVYLRFARRVEEAAAVFEDVIATGDARERLWAMAGLANIYYFQGDLERAAELSRRAHAAQPDFYIAIVGVKDFEVPLQHDEVAFAAATNGLAIKRDPDVTQLNWDATQASLKGSFAQLRGDYLTELEVVDKAREISVLDRMRAADPDLFRADPLLGRHETTASEALHGVFGSSTDFNIEGLRAKTELAVYAAQGRWATLLKRRAAIESGLAGLSPYSRQFISRNIWPVVAYAMAKTGDVPGAHSLMNNTPTDCSLCLRMRGRLDALDKNWAGANDWFSRAARFAPSTPFPFQDWGQALLDKGDANDAIAKFSIAHQKGPHFADPLEGWGEALMANNTSHLALAKFEEANNYAPKWGRLHLKWGEALAYAGQKDKAKAEFTRASQLDLTGDERSELAGMTHG